METRVASQHEVQTAFAHEPFEAIVPHYVEFLRVFQNVFRCLVGHKVDSRWTESILAAASRDVFDHSRVAWRFAHIAAGRSHEY